MKFLFLEPFYGGSHRDFADGLVTHSRYDIDLVTLPDRFWKWRMRGAAIYWSRRIDHLEQYDGLIVSSLLNLGDLKALWGESCPPGVVYFHENQLTYPSAPDNRHDHQPGFTNIITALSAKRLLFNSHTHLEAFLTHLPQFIKIMPDFRPKWVTREIEEISAVAYPGCHFQGAASFREKKDTQQPLVIWNHRWEHDKNPESFFGALEEMIRRGIEFQVALLGEEYAQMPEVFKHAPGLLGDRLVQYGMVPSRKDYYQWLDRGDIVVSTAVQENFGIAVVEAMWHGCLPLLPHRLSYPELLPKAYHANFLYQDQTDFETKLAHLLTRRNQYSGQRRGISQAMEKFGWKNRIGQFDDELERLATAPSP